MLYSFQVKPFYEEFTQSFHLFCNNKSTDTQFQTKYLTEEIIPHDPRCKHFKDAIKKEIIALSSQNTSEIIQAKKVSKNATSVYG